MTESSHTRRATSDSSVSSPTRREVVRLREALEAAYERGHWDWPTMDMPTRAELRKKAVDELEAALGEPELKQMADAAEMLWVVLANVSGGDWTKQSADWQEYAARWRDSYFEALTAYLRLTRASEGGEPVTRVSEPAEHVISEWHRPLPDRICADCGRTNCRNELHHDVGVMKQAGDPVPRVVRGRQDQENAE